MGLDHLFGVLSLVSPCVAVKCPWAGLPTRSFTALSETHTDSVLFQSVLLVYSVRDDCLFQVIDSLSAASILVVTNIHYILVPASVIQYTITYAYFELPENLKNKGSLLLLKAP